MVCGRVCVAVRCRGCEEALCCCLSVCLLSHSMLLAAGQRALRSGALCGGSSFSCSRSVPRHCIGVCAADWAPPEPVRRAVQIRTRWPAEASVCVWGIRGGSISPFGAAALPAACVGRPQVERPRLQGLQMLGSAACLSLEATGARAVLVTGAEPFLYQSKRSFSEQGALRHPACRASVRRSERKGVDLLF